MPSPAWKWPFLTREASVNPVVASPEPENRTPGICHPVHRGSSHLLKMVSAVSTAKEEPNVVPHGLEDLLAVSCRKRRYHRKALGLASLCCLHQGSLQAALSSALLWSPRSRASHSSLGKQRPKVPLPTSPPAGVTLEVVCSLQSS